MIQSTKSERVKQLVKLKQKKYREQTKQFLAEGEHLVEEAIKQHLALEVFCLDGASVPAFDGVITEVSRPVLEKLTFSKTPQSMVALCKYHQRAFDMAEMRRVFLLDGLQDPGNIGTIIRTSLAMGFDGVILSEDSVDLYNDKLLRACQGANFYLPVISAKMTESIEQLQASGFKVFATALHEARPIQEIPTAEKMAFVMGNEGNGVKKETIKKCDGSIYIPISKAESLNVAIAAGMFAFQFRKS